MVSYAPRYRAHHILKDRLRWYDNYMGADREPTRHDIWQ